MIGAPPEQPLETSLAVDERQRAQILAIEPEQIEGVEESLPASKHQLLDLRASVLIQTHDLAIKDRFITAQVICDRGECSTNLQRTGSDKPGMVSF